MERENVNFLPLERIPGGNKAKKNNWLNKYSAWYIVCMKFFGPYLATINNKMLATRICPGRETGVGAVREPPIQVLPAGATFPAPLRGKSLDRQPGFSAIY